MERFHAATGLPMHRMLAQTLPGADAALVQALAEELSRREPKAPQPVWEALFARWVRLDAPAALAWARLAKGQYLAEMAIKAGAEADLDAAIAWHRNNPDAAHAWLEALPDSPAKTRALTELDPPRQNAP